MKRALVLAGGGVAGIAWELGVLRGIHEADAGLARRVIDADLIIGTSAGSAVAAQITSGVPLDDLYAAQLSEESAEIEVELDMDELLARFAAAVAGVTDQQEMQRAIGGLALDTPTVPEPERLAAVAARLPVPLAGPGHDAACRGRGHRRASDLHQGLRGRAGRRGRRQLRGAGHLAAGHDRRPPLHRRRVRSIANADLAAGLTASWSSSRRWRASPSRSVSSTTRSSACDPARRSSMYADRPRRTRSGPTRCRR